MMTAVRRTMTRCPSHHGVCLSFIESFIRHPILTFHMSVVPASSWEMGPWVLKPHICWKTALTLEHSARPFRQLRKSCSPSTTTTYIPSLCVAMVSCGNLCWMLERILLNATLADMPTTAILLLDAIVSLTNQARILLYCIRELCTVTSTTSI